LDCFCQLASQDDVSFILAVTYSYQLPHPVPIVESNFDIPRDRISELEAAMSRRQWSVLFFESSPRRWRGPPTSVTRDKDELGAQSREASMERLPKKPD
jgi:hypothetical protein